MKNRYFTSSFPLGRLSLGPGEGNQSTTQITTTTAVTLSSSRVRACLSVVASSSWTRWSRSAGERPSLARSLAQALNPPSLSRAHDPRSLPLVSTSHPSLPACSLQTIYRTEEEALLCVELPSVFLVDGRTTATAPQRASGAAFVSYFLAHFRRRPHARRSSIRPRPSACPLLKQEKDPPSLTRDLPASHRA